MMERERKFRQAAFAYLHVGILYEGAAIAMMRADLLPSRFGPPWIYLLVGAAIVTVVMWGLWSWQNVWFARAIWLVHGLRVPTLIAGAFFPGDQYLLGQSFYGTALLVVMINLWMLARAGWDL